MKGNRVFGLERQLSRDAAQELSDSLEELWGSVMGDTGDLAGDLSRLKVFFDPVATSKRLRSAFEKIPQNSHMARRLESPQVLQIDNSHFVVTPEGRAAMALLRDQLVGASDPLIFDDPEIVRVQTTLLDQYQEWNQHRILQTIEYLSGKSTSLRLPSIGFLLYLLVNRCTSPERGLPHLHDVEKSRTIERTVIGAIHAFASALGADRLKSSKEGLYRSWWLGELGRHIGKDLVRADSIYLRSGEEARFLGLAAQQLARRQVDRYAVGRAFDDLVERLREDRHELASFGLDFERPAETEQIREKLMALMTEQQQG